MAAVKVADGGHGEVYLSENSCCYYKPQRHSFFSLILGKSDD